MSLFSAIQVSASGMAAQRTRAEMLVENMANAETTRTEPPRVYRRRVDLSYATSTGRSSEA